MAQASANKTSLGTALITGASSGFGATYADRLARRGYNLILVARDQQRLTLLADELRTETGTSIDIIRADLTDNADLAIVEHRLCNDAAITMLVNNAGVAAIEPLSSADLNQIENMIPLNVMALTRLASIASTEFVARKKGILINLAPVAALASDKLNASYSTSKAYALNLTQTLHHEISRYGIQVQAVLPDTTHAEIRKRSGTDTANPPAAMIMEVDAMVDAALAGLDQGELITITSLPDVGTWEHFLTARAQSQQHLPHQHAAPRVKAKPSIQNRIAA